LRKLGGKGKAPVTKATKATKATKVTERVEAYYEVQEVEMGKGYKWYPESIVVRCGCGERLP